MITRRPIYQREAKRYIAEYHSHSGVALPAGWLFGTAAYKDGELAGVGMAGRPEGRGLDKGLNVEITRVCTLGIRNACSAIYAGLCQAAKGIGFERAYTYTLASECAACPRAAGFELDQQLPERGGWDNGRARVEVNLLGEQRTPTEAKVRWVRRLR